MSSSHSWQAVDGTGSGPKVVQYLQDDVFGSSKEVPREGGLCIVRGLHTFLRATEVTELLLFANVPDAPGVSSQSQSVDLMVGALADDSPDRPPRWMGELDGVKDQIASDESNLEVEAKDVQCVCGFVQEFDRGLCSGLGSGQAARKKERKKERGEKQMEEKRKSHIGKGWQGYSGALQARSK